jgi:hypothetical protein
MFKLSKKQNMIRLGDVNERPICFGLIVGMIAGVAIEIVFK